MKRGYVRLWRKSLDAGWIKNHKLWAFWTWCLLKATHKEFDAIVGLRTVHLMPGQFIFGRDKAAEETGLTPKEVRGRIDFLSRNGNMAIKKASKFSVITIINWDTYQGKCFEKGQQKGKRRANKRPHTNTEEHKKNIFRENALEILSYLNQRTGKKYRDTSFIEARLKDGGTVEECKRIIDTKLNDPHFQENPRFLNPQTLFRPSHWDKYLNEAPPLTEDSERSWFKTPSVEVGNA